MLTNMQAACRDFVRDYMLADVLLTGSFKEASEVTDVAPLPDGFTLYEVRGVTEETDLPEDRHVIYVKVREAPSPLTFLKDCMIEISVGSPVDVEGVTIAGHSALEEAVERVWDKTEHPTAAADLTAKIEAHLAAWTGADFFAEGWQEAREGTELLPVYTVKAGVKKRGL